MLLDYYMIKRTTHAAASERERSEEGVLARAREERRHLAQDLQDREEAPATGAVAQR